MLAAAAFPFLVRAQGIVTAPAGANWIFPRTSIHAALAPPGRGLAVVAGNGMKGFWGGGGPAGVAVDAAGNVYLAGAEGFRVRKFSSGRDYDGGRYGPVPGPGNPHRGRTAQPSGDHRGAPTTPPRLENRLPNGILYLS
jgi:hypothetical protein